MKYILSLFVLTSVLLLVYVITQIGSLFSDKTNTTTLDYLKTIKKGVIVSSILTRETTWKVLSIEEKEGNIPRTNNIKYGFRLRLLIDNTYTWRYEYYPKNQPVFIPEGLIYKKGRITDLQPGNNILMEAHYNYNVNNNKITTYDVTLTKEE